MPNLVYTRVETPTEKNLTVYKVPEFDTPYQADSSHALWSEILAGVLADDIDVLQLFNIANTLKRELVSERIQIANGQMYFDGDEVDDGIAQFVVRMISEGDPQYTAFVNFTEKLYSNPQEHSREHLFKYLRKYNISITPEGDMILYKSLCTNRGEYKDQKPYVSGTAGPANVSGYEHTDGPVPQAVGDVVSMPRLATWTQPNVACSTGLHVAHWGYWGGYGHETAVLVNPRDVVSVPHDDSKIRCCRYKIIGVVTEPYTDSVVNGIVVPPIPEFTPAKPPTKIKFEDIKEAAKARMPKTEDSPQEPAPAFTAPATKIKHPSKAEFEAAMEVARSQRKGLKNYIGKRWTLLDGDGSNRKHWSKG